MITVSPVLQPSIPAETLSEEYEFFVRDWPPGYNAGEKESEILRTKIGILLFERVIPGEAYVFKYDEKVLPGSYPNSAKAQVRVIIQGKLRTP